MVKTLGNDPGCSIARSLAVIGERWTLLVVREAFFGRTRFSEFRERLGISPDVLAARLGTLVESGVLQRRTYREEGAREREEYLLTAAGHDLAPVLGALVGWGDAHRPNASGPTVQYRDRATGEPIQVAFTTADGRRVAPEDVDVVRGPGALLARA